MLVFSGRVSTITFTSDSILQLCLRALSQQFIFAIKECKDNMQYLKVDNSVAIYFLDLLFLPIIKNNFALIFELRHEKTGFLPKQKQLELSENLTIAPLLSFFAG